MFDQFELGVQVYMESFCEQWLKYHKHQRISCTFLLKVFLTKSGMWLTCNYLQEHLDNIPLANA